MNIAVLGASGKTGQVFVNAALQAGHLVQAGIHHLPLSIQHPNLVTVPCDVANADDIKNLIDGCDVIVSLIGHSRHTPPHTQASAMNTLVKLLDGKDVRVISLTGTGVRLPADKVRLIDYFVTALLQLTYHKRIQDGIDHFHILQASNTQWTVLRVMKLGNGALQSYTLTPHGPPAYNTNRQTVSQAILEILQAGTFKQSAPIISAVT